MNGFTSLLWFAAVLAAIPLVLWLLKRTPIGGAAAGAPGTPRTVAVLPLSPSQRVVTVEVGQGEDRLWLVLGVTPQAIQTLYTMGAQPSAPTLPGPPPAAAFSQLLGRLRQGGAGGAGDPEGPGGHAPGGPHGR